MKNLNVNQGVAVGVALVVVAVFIIWIYQTNGFGFRASTEEAASTVSNSDQLAVRDEVVGPGEAAAVGDTVTVNYVGTLTNGQKFDSSYDNGVPFSFVLGQGQVIPGWDLGLIGMKAGGKRQLVIPASLAYGDQTIGPIPPNSTLIFEVELLEVKHPTQ